MSGQETGSRLAAQECAPIAMFVYARPEHTRRALQSLCDNDLAERSHLTVFSDGPRGDADVPGVQATRELVRSMKGLASITLIEREVNLGLAGNIVDGVSTMCDRHGRVIVLEDDLVISPHFLRFMNDGLACYEHDARVASIHGYCYPTDAVLAETFFLRGADCWGWATWARAWRHFRSDGRELLAEIRARGLEHEFDLDRSFPFCRMLEDQTLGRNDSWAIRWHAACFLDDMLTLYPGRSLVENIGNDSSGTHGADTPMFSQAIATGPVRVCRIEQEPSAQAGRAFSQFLRRQQRSARIRSMLRRFWSFNKT
jgi:hypothetical protein